MYISGIFVHTSCTHIRYTPFYMLTTHAHTLLTPICMYVSSKHPTVFYCLYVHIIGTHRRLLFCPYSCSNFLSACTSQMYTPKCSILPMRVCKPCNDSISAHRDPSAWTYTQTHHLHMQRQHVQSPLTHRGSIKCSPSIQFN